MLKIASRGLLIAGLWHGWPRPIPGMLSIEDGNAVERILDAMAEGCWKRHIQFRVSGGQPLQLRQFFWSVA